MTAQKIKINKDIISHEITNCKYAKELKQCRYECHVQFNIQHNIFTKFRFPRNMRRLKQTEPSNESLRLLKILKIV